MRLVLDMFDVVRMKNLCNVPSCGNKPIKEATIYQMILNRTPRPLVSLYLCKDHVHLAKDLIEKFKKIDTKSIFNLKIRNL